MTRERKKKKEKEKLHRLYHLLNRVRGMKSKRLRWAGHVARMEEDRNALNVLTREIFKKESLGSNMHIARSGVTTVCMAAIFLFYYLY